MVSPEQSVSVVEQCLFGDGKTVHISTSTLQRNGVQLFTFHFEHTVLRLDT